MTSTCIFTEVKQQYATLVRGWLTTSVHYIGISDSFAAHTSRPKPLSALLMSLTSVKSQVAEWSISITFKHLDFASFYLGLAVVCDLLSTSLGRVFFVVFFSSPDFHEQWHGHNDCLSFTEVVAWPQWLCFTEVKQ